MGQSRLGPLRQWPGQLGLDSLVEYLRVLAEKVERGDWAGGRADFMGEVEQAPLASVLGQGKLESPHDCAFMQGKSPPKSDLDG